MSNVKQQVQVVAPSDASIGVSPSLASLPSSYRRSLSSFYSGADPDPKDTDEKPPALKRERTFNLVRSDTTSLEEVRNILGISNLDSETIVGGPIDSIDEVEDKDSPRKRESKQWGRVSSASQLNISGEKKKFGMFGRKVEYATMDDINGLNEMLREEIGRNRSRMGDVLEKFVSDMNNINGIVEEMKHEHEQHRDSIIRATEQFTEHCIEQIRNELHKTTTSLHHSLDSDLQTAQQLLHDLHHNIVPSLSARLDADLRQTCANLSKQAGFHEKQVTEQMALQTRELNNVASRLRTECASVRADCDKFVEQVQRGETLQKERLGLQDVCLKDIEARLMLRMEQVSQSVLELAEKTDELHLEARSEFQSLLDAFCGSYDARVSTVEDKVAGFNSAVANAAGMPTRRVEWRIKDASKVLFSNDTISSMPMCWLSPKFDAAGAQNLQMELGLIHREAGLGSCDVSLRLWGVDGLHLVFRLYIGDNSAQMKHTFVGRSPCESKQIVSFVEALNPADDTLRVGIEIIEAIRISSSEGNSEVAPISTFDGLFASRSENELDNKSESCMLKGLMLEHHYINHGTLDLVKEQVNLMQSRMTRRVEWKVEQASMLSRCFSQGESICSSAFEAAGLQGLQLVFYPSGYDGAKEGFCSFFLSCPSGSSLRCSLHAGKQHREARTESEQPGFLGRTNFCRLDNCIEAAGDYVLLALEIEEAQQAITKHFSHNLTSMSISGNSQERPQSSEKNAATIPATPPCKAQSPLTARVTPRAATTDPCGRSTPLDSVESVMRLHRAPGKMALEDVKQLPSIWTPKPLVKIGDVLEGFYRFSDIKSRKLPAGARRVAASAPYGSVEGSLEDDEVPFCQSGTENSISSRASPRTERFRRMSSNKFSAYAT